MMDPQGNIYPVSDLSVDQPDYITREDMTRLDDFLSRRAERDEARRLKYLEKYGTQVWDSRSKGQFRKENKMGIEGIENFGAFSPQQGDPGDEQPTYPQPPHHPTDPDAETAEPPVSEPAEAPDEAPEVDARPGESAYPGTEAEPAEAATLTPGPSGMPAEGALATPLPPEQTQTAPEPDSGWEPSGENKET